MRTHAYPQMPHNTISFLKELISDADLSQIVSSTHISESEAVLKPMVPEYEVAYSMDLEPEYKLPKITNYVNAPPSLQSSNDTTADYDDYGMLPFDFKHYKCEIKVDYYRNKMGEPKEIQYTTLPRFEDKKSLASKGESSIKNKRK